MDGTFSDEDTYLSRTRVCDLGYLREVYRKDDGTLGYRCASEPIATFVTKGGVESDTIGRKCICNALMTNAGHPQIQKDGTVESRCSPRAMIWRRSLASSPKDKRRTPPKT